MPGGRPKGYPKSGGRQKGAVDKIKREAILAAQGITPLDYMMMLVRAETPPGLDPAVAKAREELPFEAAKAAAPYVHARLQTTTLAGDPEKPQHKVLIEFFAVRSCVTDGLGGLATCYARINSGQLGNSKFCPYPY